MQAYSCLAKVLSFVAFLLSGTPSAVNQLATTAIFAKDGQPLDTLAAFFLAQCGFKLADHVLLLRLTSSLRLAFDLPNIVSC